MDAQARAFANASRSDWAMWPDLFEVPADWPIKSPEEWDADGWDLLRTAPYTPAQARTALLDRIVLPDAPDGEAERTAYDHLVADIDQTVSHPRMAGAVKALWLPDAVRSQGLTCVLVPAWDTRGHGGFRALEIVVGHHTGTSQTAKGDYPSQNVVTNGRADLAGPLCNVGLGRNGTVYVVAAGVAWHAGASTFAGFVDLNSVSLGIEAESAGGGIWTPEQMEAYPRLVAGLLRYISRGVDRYCSHRTCATPAGRKPDPRGIEDSWMRTNAARFMTGSTPSTPTPTQSGKEVMIDNKDLAPGKNEKRWGLPCGSASTITARAWTAFMSSGPRGGTVRVFAQRADGTGIADKSFTLGYNTKAGAAIAQGWELPSGTWQVNVQWDLPDGGVMVIEALGK